MTLPAQYQWLAEEDGPRMLREALALYGTLETPGSRDNPIIIGWARELGLDRVYSDDAIPWCGLFQAVVAKRATWDIPSTPLWARSWAQWGNPLQPGDRASLGDVLVFSRKGGGHVGQYVGETGAFYHVLGGNQDDAVNIRMIAKARCIAVRRAPWRVSQPENVRAIKLSRGGTPSRSEA